MSVRKISTISVAMVLAFSMGACDEKIKVADTCGDAFLDPGEECDGTEFIAEDCIALGYYGQIGDLLCTANCTIDTSACRGRCGDGEIQESDEECDGTNLGGASCEALGYHGGYLSCGADCRLELASCEGEGRCGDGVIQGTQGETCDGTELGGASCQTEGFHEGSIGCSAACTLDLSGCAGACGDGELQPEFEECEGDDTHGVTCSSLGFHHGLVSCDADNCVLDTSSCTGECGDAIVQTPFEDCDGGNLNGETCASLGYYPMGILSCGEDCRFELASCEEAGRCGDEVINGSEACDGTTLGVDPDCTVSGYYGGLISCDADCRGHDASECLAWGRCGDLLIQPGFEACDGTELGGQTCLTLGFSVGTPTCDAGCGGFSGCYVHASPDAGSQHICSVGSNPSEPSHPLYCWGNSGLGRLAVGLGGNVRTPKPVLNLSDGIIISGGDLHTCAATATGVHCWGSNFQGQLGNGDTVSSDLPVQVLVLGGGVSSLDCGKEHTCAVEASTVYCWGADQYGQLGDGSAGSLRTSPQAVPSFSAVQVVTGDAFTCALTPGGAVWCWGRNDLGQLGTSSTTNSASPAAVSALGAGVSVISAGLAHACAVKSDGTAWCWGLGTQGQLGNNTTASSLVPVQVAGLASVSGISAGSVHTCAAVSDGSVSCWGDNTYGQLGDGTTTSSLVPVPVTALTGVSRVTVGNGFTCALKFSGAMWCWGDNAYGQLGNNGGGSSSSVPVLVWQ